MENGNTTGIHDNTIAVVSLFPWAGSHFLSLAYS